MLLLLDLKVEHNHHKFWTSPVYSIHAHNNLKLSEGSLQTKIKAKIKVQQGQWCEMSSNHWALKWSVYTPTTVMIYWTCKIFDLYHRQYHDLMYQRLLLLVHGLPWAFKRPILSKNLLWNQDNAHFWTKFAKLNHLKVQKCTLMALKAHGPKWRLIKALKPLIFHFR